MSEYIKAINKLETINSDWYEFTANQVVSMFELEVAIGLEDWTSFVFVLTFSMDQVIGFHHTGWAMDTLLSFDLPTKHRVEGVKVCHATPRQSKV